MENKIQSVIIDDDETCLQNLKSLLDNHFSYVKVKGVANSIDSGLLLIQKDKPDLVFLDINFSEGSGFDLLSRIDTLDFEVIFTTEHSHYALQAIEIAALYYIVKPVNVENLTKALDRYTLQRNQHSLQTRLQIYEHNQVGARKKMMLPTRAASEVAEINNIVHCSSDNGYTIFFFSDGSKMMVCKSIGHYEEVLGTFGFIRIHNRHLINLSFVKQIKTGRGGNVVLADGTVIPISESGKSKIEEKLNGFFLS